MSNYRFFLLNLEGRVVDGILQDCIDDLDALDKARGLSANRIVEVWHAGRHVAKIKMEDSPLNERDSSSL